MRVEIIDITDRSGSMAALRGSVITGFNLLLKDQQSVEGEARLTHVQFDDHYELAYQARNIQDAPPLNSDTYMPRGCTALFDAIGRTLNQQGERIAKEGWAEKVIVSIRTDGFENASREYTQAQIRTMIEHAQAHGWVFIFSAANQDAFATGAAMGVSGVFTANYAQTDQGIADSYAATNLSIRSLRSDAIGKLDPYSYSTKTE